MIRSRFLWLSLACAALAAGAVFAVLQSRTRAQRAVAAAGVPARPNVQDWPEQLGRDLGAAEDSVYVRGDPFEGLAKLATLYHANGFYSEAQHAYRVLREVQPREPRWPHRAAHIHAVFGELEAAITLWRKVVELDPSYLPAQIGLGDALLKSGQAREAHPIFSRVLKSDPSNVYASLGLARIDISEENWAAARSKLEQIAKQTEGLLGADLLATAYERTGEPARGAALRGRQKSHGVYVGGADPWIEAVMEACYDSFRLALESGTAGIRKDTARAERLLQRALELNPNDANLNFHAGVQAEQRGAMDTAQSHLETAVRLDPALTDAWAALVRVQQKRGQTPLAARTLAQALTVNANSPVLLMERARYNKAQGRNDAAMADLRRVTRLRRDEALAFIELAGLYFGQDRIDEGIQTLEQGLSAEPGHPIALAAIAFAEIHAGRREQAERWLREITDHPRVSSSERSRLLQAYQEKFGRSFSWAR